MYGFMSVYTVTMWENPWPGLDKENFQIGPEMVLYKSQGAWYIT